jgi:bifunctional DNase/RNase
MKDKVRLNVLGITYSQVRSGAYALLLAEDEGYYRIPIVVGSAEAQAIAIKLEDIVPPRPLAHDLMANINKAFGITLDEVFIYKFQDGVFLSEMRMTCDGRQVTLDCRTSDAVAMSLRTNAPIYTTREILMTTGFKSKDKGAKSDDVMAEELSLDRYAEEELQRMLKKCVDREEYERAAEIQKVILEKKK